VAELFVHSGESSGSAAVPTPRLQGIFLPGIDAPNIQDGFGLITPLGGGATGRQYTQYGPSNIISAQETQIHDLTTNPAEGNIFNFEGLIGPQGIPGPPGAPGITQVIIGEGGGGSNSNFLYGFPDNLEQIIDLGTAVDRLLYTSAYSTVVNFVWTKTDINDIINTWNDSDINTDGSFFIIAGDDGIYVSTDGGDSWDTYNPDSDTYEQISCESSGGAAVTLGTGGKDRGAILVTSDFGVIWTEKTVTV